MPVTTPVSTGGFQPTITSTTGVTGDFGASRQYRDGVAIKTQVSNSMFVTAEKNALPFETALGEKHPDVGTKPGQRYLLSTLSEVAVGPVTDTITTSGFSVPDYVATDPSVVGGSKFSRTIGAGSTVIGIPLPMQNVNEGEVELNIDQHQGALMVFTKRFLDTTFINDFWKRYGENMAHAIRNDRNRYYHLACLYTGPLTETSGAYGALLNDAIGITNQASYALTRTLTAVNTGSNLITASATGQFGGAMTGTSRFVSAGGNNVPWLFGSSAQDVTYQTLKDVAKQFAKENLGSEGMAYIDEPGTINNLREDVRAIHDDLNRNPMDTITKGTYMTKDGFTGSMLAGFNLYQTNVIEGMGASSNIGYGIAGKKGALCYGVQSEPTLIVDDKYSKPEQCIVVMMENRYGAVVKDPSKLAVIAHRIV